MKRKLMAMAWAVAVLRLGVDGLSAAQPMAAAVAAVAGGVVTNITVIEGGTGYVMPPLVTIGGGGGSGASAQASVANGSVVGIRLLAGGSGYTNSPAVGIDPPAAVVATLGLCLVPQVTLQGEPGSVQEVQVINADDSTQAWTNLGSRLLTNGVWSFYDTNASPGRQRRYQVVTRGVERPATPEDMVWLPPGSFLMGSPLSDPDYVADEGPQTQVRLTQGFFLGRHEVTQGEYTAVMGTNTSTFAGDNHRPVETVTWAEAEAYCASLTQREQAAGRIPATWSYRLPTEAEWEYAARAGSTNRFAFSDAVAGEHAWQGGNGQEITRPVGLLRPNAWGLYDLAGNVAEWCADLYGDYPGGSTLNPAGASAGAARVVRGGSGAAPLAFCRPAARAARRGVAYRDAWLGFRVALAYARAEPMVDPVAVGGTISGTISLKDSGLPAAGVAVYLVNTNYTVDTNSVPNHRPAMVAASATGLDGNYFFPNVKPGNYAVVPIKTTPAGTWRIDHDGRSDPPELALTNGIREVNFVAQDVSLFEGGQFKVQIWLVNVPTNIDHNAIMVEHSRRQWAVCFPFFGASVEVLKAAVSTNEPARDTRGWALEKFNLSADYGWSCAFYTLDNSFLLRLSYHGVLHERLLILPVSGCPADNVFSWDWSTGELKNTYASPEDGGLVWVCPGTFWLGSPATEIGRNPLVEGPPTRVTLPQGFWMGKFEVTQGEYSAVMTNNPSKFKTNGDMSYPVESLDWSQARQYCDTLTRRERAFGRLPAGWQYRLPTEIEWEYACRAGSTTATAFGDSLGAYQAIFNGEKPYNTANVGAAPGQPVPVWFQLYRINPFPLPPNAWGFYGMHGNVAEWCLVIEPLFYPGTPVVGPAGWGAPVLPTSRGGSFLSPGVDCRSAARAWETTTDRFLPETMGFRVVLSPTSFP